ncbi:MAG TPA: hypothetical protein PK992_05675 [Planctomycetaceae bacterium]|nr:hypothetical protein [Planctomycetaceae bacterium]
MAAPIMAASCAQVMPMQATCYQTVPVTTYAQVKQTVEVPHYETTMEEREVTYMRPVTTSREVEVPHVTYQNVVENRTVNRDMGRWITRYHPVSKCAPCQVDPRPGAIGWMNRTGYSMRTAFVPKYTTSREYVPSMMTCNVPTVRQVAVNGVRRVTVQETNMVAERKTEKVPVQRMVMRREEVTVMQPQTAYRTVPVGSSMAYGGYMGSSQMAYGGYLGSSQVAYGYPVISNTTQSAQKPTPDPIGGAPKSANRQSFEADKPYERNDAGVPANGASFQSSPRDEAEPTFPGSVKSDSRKSIVPASHQESSKTAASGNTSGTRPSGWRATRKSSETSLSRSELTKPSISVADSVRER